MTDFLIVGGHGFIGSHFCKHLQSQKIAFDIYDNNTPNGHPSYEIIAARKEGLPKSIFLDELEQRKYKYLVHFGSLAGVNNGNEPIEFYENNCVSFINFIERANFEKLIYISSSSVLNSYSSPYSKSKAVAEAVALGYKDSLVIRPFTVFGPLGRPEFFITKCIDAKKRNTKMQVYGIPETIHRRFTFVGDLVECIYSSLDKTGIINCLGEKSYSLLEVLNLVGCEFDCLPKNEFEPDFQILDSAALWLCKTKLEEILPQL